MTNISKYIFKSPIIAALYYLGGKASLALAITPGYVTAIWPSSGIALAAILLFGYGIWPAIWCGSFLISLQPFFDNLTNQSLNYFIINAVAIASGASLQAIVGAYLTRCFVAFPNKLENSRDIIILIILGGLIASIISSSISVFTLAWHGSIAWENFLFSWFTWWIGDSIGILIFTPLLLIWLQPRKIKISLQRQITVTISALIIFSITVGTFIAVNDWGWQKKYFNFEKQAENVYISLQERLGDYIDNLYVIERFYNSSQFVERSEFSQFVQYAFERFPGIYALEWAPLVIDSKRNQYEKSARQDGFRDFQFSELNDKGKLVRDRKREEYFPIYYIETSFDTDQNMEMGYDLASDQEQFGALLLARDNGEISMTKRPILVRDKKNQERKQYIIFIYRALYKDNDLATIEERRESTKGFIIGAFVIDKILQSIREKILEPQAIELNLYDIEKDGEKQLIYNNSDNLEKDLSYISESRNYHLLQWNRDLVVAGKKWLLHLTQDEKYSIHHRSWEAWFVHLAGLLLTLIFMVMILMVTGHNKSPAKGNYNNPSRA